MIKEQYDLVIEPNKSFGSSLRELWGYRDLIIIMSMRDFRVRYKQTIVGFLWAFLRPLLTMIVFTVLFSKVAEMPSYGDAPYSIMVFVGMLPWFMFASSFQEGSNALVANSVMISKVYFPRIIIPLSSLFVNAIDFVISLGLLMLLMVFYQFVPSANLIFLPIFFVLLLIFTIGTILWMSALNVKYRDVRYVVPFIIQFGLYVSPVGFTTDAITNNWRLLYSLNPMVGIIDGFRWCFLGVDDAFYWPSLAISVFVTVLMFAGGLWFFRRAERKFADVI